MILTVQQLMIAILRANKTRPRTLEAKQKRAKQINAWTFWVYRP